MKNLNIYTMAEACGGIVKGTDEQLLMLKDKEVSGVVIDNRKIEPGYVFIATVGERVDGHTFIPKAMEDGALFVISERELDDECCAYIQVEKSEKALADIATYYRMQLDIPIVGITGSVGKTGTKEMIASVLSRKYNVLKTAGNYNNEIGLPLTLLSIKDEHTVAVVEMGISDFGEMHRLGDMAKPDIMVITNIGQCHLQQLHDRDGVFKAKTESFDHLHTRTSTNGEKIKPIVVLNADDDKLAAVNEVQGARIIRFGANNREADVFASDIFVAGLEAVDATILSEGTEYDVRIPLPGEHNVYHALAAVAIGELLDVDKDGIKDGIESVATIAGRSNFLRLAGNITVIDDCYNASPISVKAALTTLSRAKGRRIAVLGDMGELGEDEVLLHGEVGEHLSKLTIEELFAVGELSEEIVNKVRASESKCVCHYFTDRDAMVRELLSAIRDDDTILVKASHFMNFPEVVKAIKERFS